MDGFVEVLAIGVPIIALMIPIVAILTAHQRKMAEIVHGRTNEGGSQEAEITALRSEVAQLKQLMHQQAIALDSMNGEAKIAVSSQSPPPIEKHPA